MANPNQSEKSNAIDREENITKGNVAAKRVANYFYNSDTDQLEPGTGDNRNYYTITDDTTTANVVYLGKAPIGASKAGAVWQIAKLDTTSGTEKTWADGNDNFDNVWNNRASLSYS